MKVQYISHMGTDLTVVNAARVSFNKSSQYEYDKYNDVYVLSHQDQRLINYLSKHNHWTPFAHPQLTIHVKAPLFVARQLGKHQVGLVWNEVSRRYIDTEPEFYIPDGWRKRAENVKQGSSDEIVSGVGYDTEAFFIDCSRYYTYLLEAGVCPEQARMVLPQSTYCEWYWTGSLYAFSRVCKLRLDTHTQKETQEIARQISDIVKPLFPVSWKALQANEVCMGGDNE